MTVGTVCPTFSVPGICSSRTTFQNLNAAVVVAKLPMPNVSQKLVINPIPRWGGVGGGGSFAPSRAAPALRKARNQTVRKIDVRTASPASSRNLVGNIPWEGDCKSRKVCGQVNSAYIIAAS